MHLPTQERSSRVRCVACCASAERESRRRLRCSAKFRASSPPRSLAALLRREINKATTSTRRVPPHTLLVALASRGAVSGRAPADELSDHPPPHTSSQCVVLIRRLVRARRARELRGVGRRAERIATPREHASPSWRHSGRRRQETDTPTAEVDVPRASFMVCSASGHSAPPQMALRARAAPSV